MAPVLYEERVTSTRTRALFLALTLSSGLLAFLRANAAGIDLLSGALAVIFLFFLFCWTNYRVLYIRVTDQALSLKFGLFRWDVDLENIAGCQIDTLPALMRYGGAGLHFMWVRGRYRASLNFLEHPRIVVALRQKRGPVRDLSFSTCKPDELLRLLRNAIAASPAR